MQLTSFRRPARLGLHILAAALPAIAAHAQSVDASGGRAPQVVASPDADTALRDYWTADRLAHAKNLDLLVAKRLSPVHAPRLTKGAQQVVHGGLPTAAYDPELALELPGSIAHPEGAGLARPRLTGTSGQPFTTNKLYPNSISSIPRAYPYGTVGHLFFTEPSGDYQCSASVVRANVIATAGHCVADGNGHYYTNWVFFPAESGASKPFGMWTWANADTTSAWWSGGGGVPNEQDDALIILKTRTIGGVVHRVGDYTGYLGYEFNAPTTNAITQLGYPCNLDGCSDPVATYAQVSAGPTNTFLWGSATQGGGSGGPEIQDFGQAPSGVPSETLGGNILVASFSFYYTASGFLEDGASIFYAPGQNGEYTFGDLINWACTNTTNC
jgi:V8-like Glu-specific endopeptidase